MFEFYFRLDSGKKVLYCRIVGSGLKMKSKIDEIVVRNLEFSDDESKILRLLIIFGGEFFKWVND